jgi:phospholipid/cholesterol/gamma-HCH transport system ATP-binding protein
VISFKDVKKAFDSNVVLDGFSLDIHDGETMIIMGYSGTGKSVALKHIVGLLEPDAGQVEVDEQIVHLLDRDGLTQLRSHVGYVFQFSALFDSMTVAENLALGLKRQALSPAEIGDRVRESLASWTWRERRTGVRRNSQEGCASAWVSPGRSPFIRGTFFTTNRPPGWTQ